MAYRMMLRCVGCLIGFVALVGVLREPASFAQKQRIKLAGIHEETPAIRDLFPGEVIPFSAAPPFMMASEMRCDLKGNIYLVYSGAPALVIGQPNAVSTLPISRLSLESKSITEYQLPHIAGYRGVLRLDFDVDPGGRVYALLTALEESNEKSPPSFFVAKYKDDGS